MQTDRIRNFSIIAHIDHGKSTLADRMLEHTGAVQHREMRDQILDDMELERERGITIKARAVTIEHEVDGETYQLNLIDTPGHVDFSYEVQKSMQACEGALLLVDSSQGVEAQTVANAYLAVEQDLEIIPVLNKIDLAHSRPDEVAEEIEHSLAIDASDALAVSAKSGEGVGPVLDRIVKDIPPPKGDPEAPLQALIFDAVYDEYRGIIVYLRLFNGVLPKRAVTHMLGTGKVYEAVEIGKFSPNMIKCDELRAGEVGYLVSNIKSLGDVRIGDTLTINKGPEVEMLPGYKEPMHMVFADFYPTNPGEFETLRDALETLSLTDSSFSFHAETSDALGFGFRCGFLGLLHAEIVQERLEREYDLNLISTAPTVRYRVVLANGDATEIESPAALPDPADTDRIEEPVILATVHVPADYVGAVLALCQERRGVQHDMVQHGSRVQIRYELPLAEVVVDFHDRIKSATRGYGSFDYDFLRYRPADLVKLDILVNGDPVDALSLIVHRDKAYARGTELVRKLKEFIPRQMFEVVLQAAIGARVVARTNVKALRKNVTAKCYGGDITRKRKLLERQKEGKRRMKKVGSVEIPQEAFMAALKLGDS